MNDPALLPAFRQGKCPDCGGIDFIKGPRGGLAINIECAACHSRFNVSIYPPDVWFAQRIPSDRIEGNTMRGDIRMRLEDFMPEDLLPEDLRPKGSEAEWTCGHVAGAMCAECYGNLVRMANRLAEENMALKEEITALKRR